MDELSLCNITLKLRGATDKPHTSQSKDYIKQKHQTQNWHSFSCVLSSDLLLRMLISIFKITPFCNRNEPAHRIQNQMLKSRNYLIKLSFCHEEYNVKAERRNGQTTHISKQRLYQTKAPNSKLALF